MSTKAAGAGAGAGAGSDTGGRVAGWSGRWCLGRGRDADDSLDDTQGLEPRPDASFLSRRVRTPGSRAWPAAGTKLHGTLCLVHAVHGIFSSHYQAVMGNVRKRL